MRDAVVLFAKAPEIGRVKTRLAARLDTAAAAALHRAFVYDMVESLSKLDADLYVATDCQNAWHDLGIPVILQRGDDLGARILRAAADLLAAGHPVCAVVGSDAPTLPVAHVRDLLAVTADVAIGPADDGGFYAIACRRTHPEMFDGVNWSTSATLRQTEAVLLRARMSYSLGATWFDVDTPADLDRLCRSELPPHTRRWMELNPCAYC